uniref:Venom protein n=1 Tax=Ampulex compressa TaxID=860918 RepID=A0A1W6EWD2_AMPCP|nr:venom protein [Ampulex compressa]
MPSTSTAKVNIVFGGFPTRLSSMYVKAGLI